MEASSARPPAFPEPVEGPERLEAWAPPSVLVLVLVCSHLRAGAAPLDLQRLQSRAAALLPGVTLAWQEALCAEPGRASEFLQREGASRLVLGLCDRPYLEAESQAAARTAGIDPFGVQILRLAPHTGAPNRVLALIAGAAARARAFPGSKPENLKAVLARGGVVVSRRALFTLPPLVYVPAVTIDPGACAVAGGCDQCVRACPAGALEDGRTAILVDRDRCRGCGLCVAACPNRAVELPGWSPAEIEAQLDAFLRAAPGSQVVFACKNAPANVSTGGHRTSGMTSSLSLSLRGAGGGGDTPGGRRGNLGWGPSKVEEQPSPAMSLEGTARTRPFSSDEDALTPRDVVPSPSMGEGKGEGEPGHAGINPELIPINPDGWLRVPVPCAASVPPAALLRALAGGASRVAVAPCSEQCSGRERSEALLDYCRALLDGTGDAGVSGPLPALKAPDRRPEQPPELKPAPPLRIFGAGAAAAAVLAIAPLRPDGTPDRLEHPASPLGLAVLDPEACTGCGACAAACPTGALQSEAEAPDRVELTFDPALCSACQRCLSVCPEAGRGALQIMRATSVAELSRGPRTIYRDQSALCQRCGAPIAPRSLLTRVAGLLGDQTLADTLQRYCPDCRGLAF